jgi:aminoglycoside phosphotransferase (APT) family kinase protein
MSLVLQRDPATVSVGLARWLEASRGVGYEIVRCDQPADGLSSETFLCDARAEATGEVEAIAVRLPPLGDGAFPSYDLSMQADAQRTAAAHGIPAPAPVEIVSDETWLNAPFMVMPAIDGRVPGAAPIYDKWITSASPDLQRKLYLGFVAQLAAIHQIDAVQLSGSLPRRDLDHEIAYWREYLAWYADGEQVVPALNEALEWCATNQPRDEAPLSLLWGDVRLGNVIFDEERSPVGVLDWEMATIGPPEHDVAWWRTLEATQDELLGRRVQGFPTADEALELYESALGRPLTDLPWYEVFAMVRSTAVMTRLGVLNERAGNPTFFPLAENPLLPLITRRIEHAR